MTKFADFHPGQLVKVGLNEQCICYRSRGREWNGLVGAITQKEDPRGKLGGHCILVAFRFRPPMGQIEPTVNIAVFAPWELDIVGEGEAPELPERTGASIDIAGFDLNVVPAS